MLRARVARAVSSWVLNISKDEDSVIVSGQIHSIKTLSYFGGISFIPFSAYCFLSYHLAPLRSVWLPFLYSPLRCLLWMDKMPLRLLSSRLNSPWLSARKVFQSFNHLCGPSLVLSQYVPVSLVLGNTALQMLLTGAKQKGRITSLDLMAMLCLMQPQGISPQECLAFFAAKGYSWLMVNLVPPGAPGPSLHICFPAGWPPACAGTWGFIPPQVQALHSLLLNLIRYALAHFFSLLGPLWMACPSCASAALSSFVLAAEMPYFVSKD